MLTYTQWLSARRRLNMLSITLARHLRDDHDIWDCSRKSLVPDCQSCSALSESWDIVREETRVKPTV